MESSFAELTHAPPDHESYFSDAAGAKDEANSSRVSARDNSNGSGGNSGGADSTDAVTARLAAVVTTGAPAAPATPISRSGSGTLSPAHAPSQVQVTHSSPPSSSTTPPNLVNCHASPPSTSPPSKHSILHAHRQSHNSSKLPAYRFADLNKESIAIPSLLQHQQQQIPPSPVSPDLDRQPETHPNTVNQFTPPTAHSHLLSPETTQSHNHNHDIVPPDPLSENLDPVKSRASTFQTQSAPSPQTSSSPYVKRSVSLDSTTIRPNTAGVRSPSESTETIVTVLQRRSPTSPITPLGQDTDTACSGLPAEATTREAPSGQRELLLPKSLQRTASDDKRTSVSRRPPVSYKPRTSSSGSVVTASIPPIRSFRSSGERRSLVLDMNLRSARNYDGGDDYGDSNHRDRTLRALEGRRGDEVMQWTPPDSAGERPDGDDSGDLFLKIAREDSSQRTVDNARTYADNPSAIVSGVLPFYSCSRCFATSYHVCA
jgi:hypothetical protein